MLISQDRKLGFAKFEGKKYLAGARQQSAQVFVSFQRALSSSPYLAWKIGVQISDMQNCKVYRETKQSVLGLAIKTLLTPYGYEYVPDGTTHPVRLPMPFHANFLIPDLLLNSLSNQSLATFTS